MKFFLIILISFTINVVNAQWQLSTLKNVEVTSLDSQDSSIFVGTEDGLYISRNYGEDWDFINSNVFNFYKVNSVVAKDSIIFAGTNNGLRMSLNYGKKWMTVSALINFTVNSVLIHENKILTASLLGVSISTDSGSKWEHVNNGLPDLAEPVKLISQGSSVFVITDNTIYKSIDNGQNWTIANTGLENNLVFSLVADKSIIYAGTDYGVYVSNNGGSIWEKASIGLPDSKIYSIVINGSKVFAATENGVYISQINANLWSPINDGLPNISVKFLSISGSRIFAALNQSNSENELWSRSISELTNTSTGLSYDEFRLFPNPSNGSFRIEYPITSFNKIEVYNLQGSCIYKSENQKPGDLIQIRDIHTGCYFVKIYTNSMCYTQKLMIY